MPTILVGTEDGIHTVGGEPAPVGLRGREVAALSPSGDDDGMVWALVDGRELWRGQAAGEGQAVASSPGPPLRCLAAAGGTVLAGTAEAHLLRLEAGELRRLEPFDQVEGRDGWYTPWGGPPDVRSVAVGADGGDVLVEHGDEQHPLVQHLVVLEVVQERGRHDLGVAGQVDRGVRHAGRRRRPRSSRRPAASRAGPSRRR